MGVRRKGEAQVATDVQGAIVMDYQSALTRYEGYAIFLKLEKLYAVDASEKVKEGRATEVAKALSLLCAFAEKLVSLAEAEDGDKVQAEQKLNEAHDAAEWWGSRGLLDEATESAGEDEDDEASESAGEEDDDEASESAGDEEDRKGKAQVAADVEKATVTGYAGALIKYEVHEQLFSVTKQGVENASGKDKAAAKKKVAQEAPGLIACAEKLVSIAEAEDKNLGPSPKQAEAKQKLKKAHADVGWWETMKAKAKHYNEEFAVNDQCDLF